MKTISVWLKSIGLFLAAGALPLAAADVVPPPAPPGLNPPLIDKTLPEVPANLLAPLGRPSPLLPPLLPGASAAPPVFGQPTNLPVAVKPQFPNGTPLVFDAATKELQAKPEEVNAHFVFTVTNPAPFEVIVTQVRTSCGCTTAELPPLPWHISPGGDGKININVDLRGKHGLIQKLVSVETDHGFKTLEVKVNIGDSPSMGGGQDRARNLLIATVDRQSVFKNDCAKCHATPTIAKTGEALYSAACGICHEPDNRASMVPDLRTASPAAVKNADYWKSWITSGKPGTLMPAFSRSFGGPLSDEQIDVLAKFLEAGIPAKKSPMTPLPVGAPTQ